MAGPGHNSRIPAAERLTAYVKRIEALKADRKAVSNDIKDVFTEAKSNGFNPKIIRNVLRIRDIDPKDFEEEMEATNQYLRAIGMPEVDLSAAHDL